MTTNNSGNGGNTGNDTQSQRLLAMNHPELAAYAKSLEIRIARAMETFENMGAAAEQVLHGFAAMQSSARTVAIRIRSAQQELDGGLPLSSGSNAEAVVPPPLSKIYPNANRANS